MKRINRSKFFTFLGTGFLSVAVFRNFNFDGSRKKTIGDNPVRVKLNPMSVSRKSRESNVR